MFEIRGTDTPFSDSPDVGDPDCLCSRCGLVIGEDNGHPIRAWTDEREWRYHDSCLEGYVGQTDPQA